MFLRKLLPCFLLPVNRSVHGMEYGKWRDGVGLEREGEGV